MPRRAIKLIVGLLLLQVLLVAAFVVPAHDPRPHDLPVGVVGPAKLPGAFDVHRYADATVPARRSSGATCTAP